MSIAFDVPPMWLWQGNLCIKHPTSSPGDLDKNSVRLLRDSIAARTKYDGGWLSEPLTIYAMCFLAELMKGGKPEFLLTKIGVSRVSEFPTNQCRKTKKILSSWWRGYSVGPSTLKWLKWNPSEAFTCFFWNMVLKSLSGYQSQLASPPVINRCV